VIFVFVVSSWLLLRKVMSHDEEGSEVRFGGYRMRLPSPLSEDAERAMSETIACAIRVHRELGPGFLESIYRKAIYLELEAAGMSYESERVVQVRVTAAPCSAGNV
jgi:hypothetical protein